LKCGILIAALEIRMQDGQKWSLPTVMPAPEELCSNFTFISSLHSFISWG